MRDLGHSLLEWDMNGNTKPLGSEFCQYKNVIIFQAIYFSLSQIKLNSVGQIFYKKENKHVEI